MTREMARWLRRAAWVECCQRSALSWTAMPVRVDLCLIRANQSVSSLEIEISISSEVAKTHAEKTKKRGAIVSESCQDSVHDSRKMQRSISHS